MGNGRLIQAANALGDGMQLADENGGRFLAPCMVNVLAWVYCEMGDIEASVRLGLEGVRQGQEAKSPEAGMYSRLHLAGQYVALRAEEQLSEAQRKLDENLHFKWRIAIRLDEEFASYWLATRRSEKSRRACRLRARTDEPHTVAQAYRLGA